MTLRVDPAHRGDLLAFAERVRRLDEAAVVRLRSRPDGLVAAWAATGFDVLAVRVVAGRLTPADVTVGADALRRGLLVADPSDSVDTGFPMDSAWRGALPPDTGFSHLDDIPAVSLAELSRRATDLAKEAAGPQGPPASLLDQEVLEVSAGSITAAVPVRCVLALSAMGFLTERPAESEVVRVRVAAAWLRIDARYGSVARRRGDPALLLG